MTQTSVIRKLILSQQPRKRAGFLHGSAMCPPLQSPHKYRPAQGPSHQLCHLVAGGKPQQMTSTCPEPSRTSQMCDCHGGEPLETFVIDPKLWPCAFRAWSFGADTFHYAGIVCIYKNINRTISTCIQKTSLYGKPISEQSLFLKHLLPPVGCCLRMSMQRPWLGSHYL